MELDVLLINVFLLENVKEQISIASTISPLVNVPKEKHTMLIPLLVSLFTTMFTSPIVSLQIMLISLQLTQMEIHPLITLQELALSLHVTTELLPTILVALQVKEATLALVFT